VNDWLDQFAACHDTTLADRVSLHEVAMCDADHGSLVETGRALVGPDSAAPRETDATRGAEVAGSANPTDRPGDREDREPVR